MPCKPDIRAVACVLLLTLSLPVVADKSAMTLDDIARIKFVQSATISPDGQSIAYVESVPRNAFTEDDGPARTHLRVIRGAGKSQLYVGGDLKISNVVWAANSGALYYLGKGKDDEQNALYAMPLTGGASETVCQLSDERSISSFALHPDGKRMALISKPAKSEAAEAAKEKGFDALVYEEGVRYKSVAVVAINTEEGCDPQPFDVTGHVSAVSFSADGSRLLVKVARSPHIDDSYMQTRLRVLNLEGAELSRIDNLGKLGQAVWSPNAQKVGLIGVNDFNDPAPGRLKVADPKTGQLRTLFDGLEGHFRQLVWAGNNSVYALVHLGVESELWRVDLASGEHQVLIEQGQQVIQSIAGSLDGNTLAIIADSPEHPRELFRWSAETKLERLTISNPWLAEIELGQQQTLNYKAADGLDLQGLVIYPTNYKKGKRYPLIVYVHGGPESHRSNGWLSNYSTPIQVAAAQGYVAFVPNYRGSTGRGVAFSKLDQHAYATPEFDDIVDGKNHLVESGLVDKTKVGITGGSYGGYATAWSATALTEHYAAGVMFVGISNQISKFGTTDIAQEMHAVHSRAWPWEDWQFMLKSSPIYHAQKSKTPLLIMHGDADPRVNPEQSLEMYRYLKLAGQAPVRLVLYPGEKHGNKRAASRYDYSVRMMRWMDHYLKGPGGEPPAYEIDYSEKLKSDEDKETSNG